jgi:hypothetical protein
MEGNNAKGALSGGRLGRLVLRELATGYRSVLIAMAAVAGVIIITAALTMLGFTVTGRGAFGRSLSFYLNYFEQLLFIGGFIVTSFAFREVWQNGSGIFYLTLPGSTLEKLLSKILVTAVGYAVGSLVFMAVVSLASEGVIRLLFGAGFGFPDLGAQLVTALKSMLFYVITQSVFLLGSIWFRKTALVRTALWIMIFGVAAVIAAVVTARFSLAHLFTTTNGWVFSFNDSQLRSWFQSHGDLSGLETAGRIVSWVFVGLLAPVCWLASYFRLAEAEV